MDILNLVTVVFLLIIGGLFAIIGSNVQSRLLGLFSLALAAGQGLKLVGLI
jgi:hypothetical protein